MSDKRMTYEELLEDEGFAQRLQIRFDNIARVARRQALLDAAEVVEKKLTRNGRLGKDALDKADIASKNLALFELLDELRQMAEDNEEQK